MVSALDGCIPDGTSKPWSWHFRRFGVWRFWFRALGFRASESRVQGPKEASNCRHLNSLQ